MQSNQSARPADADQVCGMQVFGSLFFIAGL